MRIQALQLQDLTILCKEHFQNLLGWKTLSERQLSDGTYGLADPIRQYNRA
ncbi:hypothetical protein DSO57_1011861 [Entomophthora muscae]|uniref:Uncharacterized protein n=1 Tax=Entomophthora muscae TaxID=34485 RepID=A0ACC2S832_9FUNG|nr:hypothetical protein DSO57_1011861 [Entomophthora muscae]